MCADISVRQACEHHVRVARPPHVRSAWQPRRKEVGGQSRDDLIAAAVGRSQLAGPTSRHDAVVDCRTHRLAGDALPWLDLS